jgi:tetratricopeptide (TPR) repeat protein
VDGVLRAAAKLAPSSPEPRVNLGVLYEQIGRLDPAISEYEQVLTIDPDNTVAMRQLARAYVKAGKKDDRLRDLLEKLLLTPGEPAWDVWIRGQLIRLNRHDAPAAAFPPPSPGDAR